MPGRGALSPLLLSQSLSATRISSAGRTRGALSAEFREACPGSPRPRRPWRCSEKDQDKAAPEMVPGTAGRWWAATPGRPGLWQRFSRKRHFPVAGHPAAAGACVSDRKLFAFDGTFAHPGSCSENRCFQLEKKPSHFLRRQKGRQEPYNPLPLPRPVFQNCPGMGQPTA